MFSDLTFPVWIAIVVIVFSFILKIVLLCFSDWYRDALKRVLPYYELGVLPSTFQATYAYYNVQPAYDSQRSMLTRWMYKPWRYMIDYVFALGAVIYLLVGMQCSFTGNCEVYAWIYVGFLCFMFALTMSRMLYDYMMWRTPRDKKQANPKSNSKSKHENRNL